MKILLDNCVHVKARTLFVGHEVRHARDLGWRELLNGDLMQAARGESFDVLVTTDKKIRFEHNLSQLPLPVLELNTHLTRLKDLITLTPHLTKGLAAIQTANFVSVHPDGMIEKLGLR